jgi:hypothetical protein
MKILLATTTFDGKKYCLDKWIDAVRKIDYPDIDILMVDNSDGLEYTEYLKSKEINAIHLEVKGGDETKINQTNKFISEYFLKGDWDRWFNLESDVLVPPEIIKTMLLFDKNTDWIGVSYRRRNLSRFWFKDHVMYKYFASEWGCSMFSRKIIQETDFLHIPDDTAVDYWFANEDMLNKGFTKVLLYNFLDIEHL